ncbi:MAG: hypothetical protein ACM3H7_05275 [Acidobacteriaceae bacterium]
MVNKPGDSIYSIVEKAYFRLQAGDVINHCLEDGTSAPVHEMIQELVLAGPRSLDALREILGEATKRKAQVSDDLSQVANQLSIILKGYGVTLEKEGGNQALQSMSKRQLLRMLDEQEIVEQEARTGSMQVWQESQELLNTLVVKIRLLDQIETYLQDWVWGLTYQSIKRGEDDAMQNGSKNELQ